jgi:REP element-mobilizing transposase RayT
MAQTEFVFRTWGGKRAGAGRPKKKGAGVSHLRRPRLSMHHPVHVTLRCVRGLPSLRHRTLRKVVFRCFGAGSERFGFRLVHFSVQSNHLHLVCEADDERALARGMQGLSIRIAKRLNRALSRGGRVFADRYHAHVLRTPREVRNVLAYVLNNARKHGVEASRRWLDSYSSAVLLDGWNTGIIDYEPDAIRLLLRDDGSPITGEPVSWLLRTGWRRHGCLYTHEVPGRRG